MATIPSQSVVCKNGTHVVLRCAVEDDAQAILELNQLLHSDGDGQVRLLEEYSATSQDERKTLRSYRDNPNWVYIVAEKDGEIIGSVHFKNGPISRLAHRGVLGIGIAPKFRSLGVGSKLLEQLIEWAETNRLIDKVSLAVVANNTRAIALYKKMGFLEEGRRVREVKYGDNIYKDDILMYRFV